LLQGLIERLAARAADVEPASRRLQREGERSVRASRGVDPCGAGFQPAKVSRLETGSTNKNPAVRQLQFWLLRRGSRMMSSWAWAGGCVFPLGPLEARILKPHGQRERCFPVTHVYDGR